MIKKNLQRNEFEERRDTTHDERASRGSSRHIKLYGWNDSDNYNNNKCGREKREERVVIVLARS